MNNFEEPKEKSREQAEPRLTSERIRKFIDRLRSNAGKEFTITETGQEYTILMEKDGETTTAVITKSGNEEIDEGALFQEIMTEHLSDNYEGGIKLGEREDI